jgi:hypothetical protein
LVGEDLLGGLVLYVQDAYEDGTLFLGWAWYGVCVAVKGLVTIVYSAWWTIARLVSSCHAPVVSPWNLGSGA